ncbi:Abi family protein [Corynebacterium belfantii]|uniref:Abi family protein n=1 Tax=Corynebacterium belfantii TaxID=2014537 RepID=UPI00248AE17F|nr:Abi family protein [Corynebacterium belfantii]
MEGQVKPPTTLEEQLELLSKRGMTLDEPLARQWLANVSYYRLSGYWYPYRVLPKNADYRHPLRLDNFVSGTSFSEVAGLYEFDRKLRALVHDGIERIEVALRTRIGEWCTQHGALAYREPALFREEFDHSSWLATVEARIERAKSSNAAIKHYADKYGQYPFWVVTEVLDFSDVSILFSGLPVHTQHSISTGLGFHVAVDRLNSKQKKSYYGQDPLARWCEQLTIVRNVCAHHARLFNRHFTPASTNAFRTIPALASLPRGQSDKLYGALLMMAFMLYTISPGTTWPSKLTDLIRTDFENLSLRSITEMGFPDNWETSLNNPDQA